ncbi:MAG: bis(5'-nucleosyl)-tetraphosphatase (symmetrical) YqeK [Candidatus Margulisbacteria bacterium]|nr:bis(5'-nucleosyl)-tetraphosphatase (symmetrical) YqeK [Candidatus Margulisiibacteriota bacterium]
MSRREIIIKRLKETLDPERFEHSLRVEKIALQLAARYRVNRQHASLAALLHDCARRFDQPGMLREARRLGLKIRPLDRAEPKLLHGELGVRLAQREFGVRQADILAAIRWHTTGQPGMSRLAKVIYLADHVEEGRDHAAAGRLRKLAFRDLDRAVIESATEQLLYLLDKGVPVDPASLETRNSYLQKRK